MKQSLSSNRRIITLLTDFGLKDPYVATMKGVILSLNSEATIVDISHEVQSQHILQAAFILFHSYRYFPEGTIHVAVVDPGVGTSRQAILLAAPGAFFLAPDNGLLSYIIGSGDRKKAGRLKLDSAFQAFSLNKKAFWREEVSQTFHGRDIFAPAAAHLSLGVAPEDMGEKIDSLLALPILYPKKYSPHELTGEVIYIDVFGNLITNIPSEEISSNAIIRVAGREIHGLSPSYEGGEELLAIRGSFGLLEIACNRGSAADLLKIKPGEKLKIYKPE